MTAVPTIITERLLLRPMTADDWEPYSALMLSERARYMGGPFSVKVAWGMFCADHAQWDLFGAGALMLEDRDTRACLGQVGINSGPLFPEKEIGWLVFPEAEGRGYAFEAASALRDWARTVRRLNTLVSYVDPQNDRSRRLAERLGATLDGTAPRPDPTDLVYRHFA
ncbi:GNAT family N-acetyltransferase [Paracoccus sp. WLY502]|uniref:GNAT family N-acetyltransferase n=1 Tax=Paracoccus yibinensis TaxID=3068891 RepID=UPI002796983E|nr:GNAT family N-acetyltransferase [Paracoccus sp. WLY502]MDQ1902082.1 GNAT family N-acetyltransferase [Paracoccus sp. WLY502]